MTHPNWHFMITVIEKYADERALDLQQYSEYHYRMIYSDTAVLDFWTTGRYYVKDTNYIGTVYGLIERAGEKGFLPSKKKAIYEFLDTLFYAADELAEKESEHEQPKTSEKEVQN